jgi:hypothetical protein
VILSTYWPRHEPIKLMGENVKDKVLDNSLGNDFLDITPKA